MSTNNSLLLAAGGACAGLVLGYMLGAAPKKDNNKTTRAKTTNNNKSESFDHAFHVYLGAFLEHLRVEYELNDKMLARVKEMCEYTCVGGKCYRGGLVSSSTKTLCEHLGVDFEGYREKAYVAGWCIEILQGMFLVADDIMDASVTRRGQLCWYKNPQVQLDAVNDSLILESFMYFLLRTYFGEDDESGVYNSLIHLYQEVSLKTEIGQMLDLVSQPQGRKPNLADFNSKLYTNIVTYKTAFYTFYLPVACGLIITGCATEQNLLTAKDVCVDIGVKFQIQDDYLDCYGDPDKIGKIGTDIQDHKCSWLCVQALDRMNAAQLEMFKANYGKHGDKQAENNIKHLFNDLDLENVYFQEEERSFGAICEKLDNLPKSMPKELFLPILKKIHKRQK